MLLFLEITGMVLWAIFCLVCIFVFPVLLWDERAFGMSITVFVLATIMSVAWFFVGLNGMGWADDAIPADGCYHLYTHEDGMWINNVYYPTSDTEYIPIHCPED